MWSDRRKEQLPDRFEEAKWDISLQSWQDADELTDTKMSYIKDTVSEGKTVKLFPHDKSWEVVSVPPRHTYHGHSQ